jgi:excisionase family DNA binding protein
MCANEIAARVADGRYPQGEWLPPIAKISADLGTSFSPVQRGLLEVYSRGLISLVENTGYYAGDGPPPSSPKPHGSHGPRSQPVLEQQEKDDEQPGDPRSALLLGEQYITVKELATLLRTSVMTIYRVIKDGEIEGVIQINERLLRIPVSSAQAYLKQCLIEGEQLSMDIEQLNDE